MKSANLLVILSLTAAALLGLTIFTLMQISETRQVARETLARAEVLSGSDSWTRSVRNLQALSKGEIETLEAAAITRNELIALIESLEASGKGMGLAVTVSSLTNEPTQASSSPQTVRMVIDAEGPWQANLSFVRLLQTLPVKSQVESSSLSLGTKAWRSGTTLKVTIFPEQ